MGRLLIGCCICSLLLTCGPAQGTADGVEGREQLFHTAYEALDAAVLERLLAENFTITYTQPPATKDKVRFLGELAELRTIFPNLRLTVDTSWMTEQGTAEVAIEGLRTFGWEFDGQPGQYTERYVHHWQQQDGAWRLQRAEVLPPE